MAKLERPGTGFGPVLRRYRLAAGLSQEDLAERAGLSARGISDLERGLRAAPRPETVRLLADGLGLAAPERVALIAAARPELSAPPEGGQPTPSAASPPPASSLGLALARPPVPPTRLVGREREVAEIVAVLRRPESRLITLTGPGGIGKTRLALAIARDVVDAPADGEPPGGAAFPDGVCWVDLAATREPGLVVGAVARALGVQEEGAAPVAETLRAALADRGLLLVLDNFEQVLPAAIEVAGWLAAAPGLKVLTTSRERLHLRGEREIPLDPLALPAPPTRGTPPPFEGLAGVAAIRLFVERAEEARHGFSLTSANASAVAEIVRRLDGLPLAIELAAARVRMLSPVDLLARLEPLLPELTDGPRDLPSRQQTLEAAVSWSHDLLRPDEQVLFRRLAVFAGGCTLQAAEVLSARVSGLLSSGDVDLPEFRDGGDASAALSPSNAREPAGSDPHVFGLLASLADKSLVRQMEGTGGQPRFSMLETIREYAQERLVASGEEPVARYAHAEYVLALVEAEQPRLKGPDQVAALTRLEDEHDNLRAALGWAERRADGTLSLRLAGGAAPFWFMRSHLSEGRAWLERALAHPGDGSAAARLHALNGAAMLTRAQGDQDRAAAMAEEMLALARASGDERSLVSALYIRGTVAQAQGDHDRATALLEEGLALARTVGPPVRVASILNILSDVADSRGDVARAIALLDEAVALKRETGDTSGLAVCLSNLGAVMLNNREPIRAVPFFEEALGLFRALKDPANTGMVLHNLGVAALDSGDLARAPVLLREGLTHFEEVGDRSGVAFSLEGFGRLAACRGLPVTAVRLFSAAESLRAAIGEPIPTGQRGDYEIVLTRALAALGAAADAVLAAGRALPMDAAVAEALSLSEVKPSVDSAVVVRSAIDEPT